MNAFVVAAFALLLGFVPLLVVCVREQPIDGLAALQLCGTLAVLVLICLGEGFHRSAYLDVPIVLVAGTWIGGLVFARFLGRYL
jgi:multisubunit Na+/H+ antiporter MnhF subunit